MRGVDSRYVLGVNLSATERMKCEDHVDNSETMDVLLTQEVT
jgi:hypothetical protein